MTKFPFVFLLLLFTSVSCASYEGRTANLSITTDPPMNGVPIYAFLLKEWNTNQLSALSEEGMNSQALRKFLVGTTPIEKHVVKLGYKHILFVDHEGMRGFVEFLPPRKAPSYDVVIPLTMADGSEVPSGAKPSSN